VILVATAWAKLERGLDIFTILVRHLNLVEGQHVGMTAYERVIFENDCGRHLGRPRSAFDGPTRDQATSKRSRFITFVHAATKSRTNFSCASELP
jgi:hypothetical protein